MLKSGEFALGVCVGLVAFIGVYLISDLLREDLNRNTLLEVIPSILTLVVAVTSLFLSFHALAEQRKMRQAGTDPVILLHLANREDARIMSTLEITNVGAGAALNVSVDLQTDISQFVPDRIITDFDKVRQTFRTIPQDKSISFNFGVGHRLLEQPEIPELKFLVTYEDIENKRYERIQKIDTKELAMQRADDGLASRQTKAIEKIEKLLGQLRHTPLHVVTQHISEKVADDEEKHKQMMEHLQEKRTEGKD
ncbi:hypothetical protein [uncultured Roseovarius sp.]|uniref:hypothetical protein n=1 Tax=uncultured Roseovarius sp. TaxID=293344 RepID=UPI0026378CA7|nr:hypothetical protein [uncultured Roseovarius sp.]